MDNLEYKHDSFFDERISRSGQISSSRRKDFNLDAAIAETVQKIESAFSDTIGEDGAPVRARFNPAGNK